MSNENQVNVENINMPFWSMVGFMVKAVIASIPATIILFIIWGIAITVFSTLFAGTFPRLFG